jgi:hypothetical protein
MSKEGVEQPPPPPVLAEIREVVARAKAGDAAALPKLQEILDQYPEVWRTFGNLAKHAEMAWVHLAAGRDQHMKECVLRYAEGLRDQLTRQAASTVEKLLVERAVGCWLQLHYHEAVEANAVGAALLGQRLEPWSGRVG